MNDDEKQPVNLFCHGCEHMWETKDDDHQCPKCDSDDVVLADA